MGSTEHSTTCDSLLSSDDSGAPRVARRGGLLVIAALISTAWAHLAVSAQPAAIGLQTDVVFTQYTPLASAEELVRRLTSPLTALQINQEAERAGRILRGQPIDLAKEHYSQYVPARPDPNSGRYSLLVFIPPWQRAEVPHHWISVLDRYHLIVVTAANSGNEANPMDRREPLALLAAHNILAQYPVDAQRVLVGGFSGGARIALRLALGYPDLFHGALLNAGSDPIGTAEVPLPPAELLRTFQESTSLVYVTGERDQPHLVDDIHSRHSLEKWCVFDVVTQTEPHLEHEVADVSGFSRAVGALLGRRDPDANELTACRARIEQELDAQLQKVEAAFAQRDVDAAKRMLAKVDAQYGGLAAPRSLELAKR